MMHTSALLALLSALAIAGCGMDDAGSDSGRVLVTENVVESNLIAVEGAASFLRIVDAAEGATVLTREFRDERMRLDRRMPSGEYELQSFVRTCVGVCPPRDGDCPKVGSKEAGYVSCGSFDPPSELCAREFSVDGGENITAEIRTKAGYWCRITLSG